MITHAFDDLPQDPGLMRTVVREANQSVGVYARVETPGRIAVGDAVEVLA
jgi:MOSC domain-containing protein YiiM